MKFWCNIKVVIYKEMKENAFWTIGKFMIKFQIFIIIIFVYNIIKTK